MNNGFSFRDTEGANPHTGSRTLPDDGDHPVMISKSDLVNSKKGNGLNLSLEYTILSGNSQGAVIKEWLSVVNSNETAQNIARSKAEAVRRVTKLPQTAEVEALVGHNMIIRTKKVPNEYVDDKGMKRTGVNCEVVMYMDMNRNNAEGKPVAAFVTTAKQDDPPANRQTTQSSGSSGYSSSAGSRSQLDDEIPF